MRSDPLPIFISLNGSFRVSDADGCRLTPTSQKAQGLLALLATGDGMIRTRQWLQSKLWSDRDSSQSAGSLRQALVQVRRAFGPDHRNVLKANRNEIWLDVSKVRVRENGRQEFLEGIDVRDPEFEDWLRHQRQSTGHLAPVQEPLSRKPSKKPQFVLRSSSNGGELADWFAQLMADTTLRYLGELFSAEFQFEPGEPVPNAKEILIQTQALSGGKFGFRIVFSEPMTGLVYWSGNATVETGLTSVTSSPAVMRLLNELVQGIADVFLRTDHATWDHPDTLQRHAVRLLFSTRRDDVAEAENYLQTANELAPRGLFHAWLAQVKAIQFIERFASDLDGLKEAGRAHIAKALEHEPQNSMVLATVANTYGQLLRDHESALLFARESVLRNPANPMAWWAQSSANMYRGNTKLSYKSALMARRLARTLPNQFWWEMQAYGAALCSGKLDQARQYAENAHVWNPNSRPALRYLIALHANAGDEEKAASAAKKLRLLEQDFSIDRLVNDHDYPASLLHRAPGMDLEKVRNLG